MQHEQIKLSEVNGYNSSYDYTIYDIGFVFSGDDDDVESFDVESFLQVYHLPLGSNGNFN